MKNAGATPAMVSEHEWRRRFISDLFHTLAQPLTALHCSLELALIKDDPDHCRRAVAEALGATERLIATTTFLRESGYADDPGEPSVVDAGELLLKVVEELAPVAGAGEVQVEVNVGTAMQVLADSSKLEQAFFLIINESLGGIAEGGTMRVSTKVQGEELMVSICGMSAGTFDVDSRAMTIASKIIAAASGSIQVVVEGESICVTVRLSQYLPC